MECFFFYREREREQGFTNKSEVGGAEYVADKKENHKDLKEMKFPQNNRKEASKRGVEKHTAKKKKKSKRVELELRNPSPDRGGGGGRGGRLAKSVAILTPLRRWQGGVSVHPLPFSPRIGACSCPNLVWI